MFIILLGHVWIKLIPGSRKYNEVIWPFKNLRVDLLDDNSADATIPIIPHVWGPPSNPFIPPPPEKKPYIPDILIFCPQNLDKISLSGFQHA